MERNILRLFVDIDEQRYANQLWFVPYTCEENQLFKIFVEYLHFASSSTGRIVTIDRRTNELLWELNMNSPLASVYLLDLDGLISVPFTIMANHSLSNLAMELAEYPLSYQSQSGFMKL